MRILFVGAHPDDLELLCGGTIRKAILHGHEVWMAVSTNGNVGSPTLDRDAIAAVRKEEASAAAQSLGAKGFIWLNEEDEFLFDDRRTRLKFVDAIREARAEIVITHNPNDYHPDHITTSKCVTDARILAGVRLIETAHPHLAQIPELFYMDSVAGIHFQPQLYVDISDVFHEKEKAIHCHASQAAWVQTIFGFDYCLVASKLSAFRGLQAGVEHAEAFVQPEYWPRKTLTLPLFQSANLYKN